MTSVYAASLAATALGFVPVAWCAAKRTREPAYWWLAGALGVSGVADTVAWWYDPWLLGFVYSVLQVSLIGLVLLWRQEALLFASVIAGVGVLAAWWEGNITLLVTAAWLGVVGIVWDRPLGALRVALLVYFGLGWLAWLIFAAQGTFVAWGGYQMTRLLGISLFCWAAAHPRPVLRLA